MKAQDLIKSDFKKTEWFADNKNRNFYESDTITITRILKFNNENEKLNETYIKLQRNENGDITRLNFKKSGKLLVEDLNVENWTNTKFVGKWKWKFDSKKQILSLYFKRKLHSAFRIESKKKDNIIWEFEYNNKKTESKLNLLVLNLVRLKK
jgi:outer membrane usher protein FimD/PapC